MATTMSPCSKRRPRRSSLSRYLGMGALAVALLARLIAHTPSPKQRPLSQMRPEGKWQERSVQICVDVKLSL